MQLSMLARHHPATQQTQANLTAFSFQTLTHRQDHAAPPLARCLSCRRPAIHQKHWDTINARITCTDEQSALPTLQQLLTDEAVATLGPTSTMKSSAVLPYVSNNVPMSGTSVLSPSCRSGTCTLWLSSTRPSSSSTACVGRRCDGVDAACTCSVCTQPELRHGQLQRIIPGTRGRPATARPLSCGASLCPCTRPPPGSAASCWLPG